MRKHPARDAARLQRRLEKLPPDPRCTLCGETDPWALCLQRHHFLTAATDADAVVALCLNCHARWTEFQRQFGVSFQPLPDTRANALNQLRSLEVLHLMVADAIGRQVARLERAVVHITNPPEEPKP